MDAKGRLVVIELKRGYTGEHMELQALRYAAMVANMTFQQTVDTYQAYMEKRAGEPGRDTVEEGNAEIGRREHLASNGQDDSVVHTEMPRIILASEDFGKELTTCIMWLNDSWLKEASHEIKCIRLQPHRNGDEILIETSVVTPLPEADNYRTRLRQREQETRAESLGKAQTYEGVDEFKESIERASETFQPRLKSLYEAAIVMEQAKTAELSTTGKGESYIIDLKVPGTSQKLVSFMNVLRYQGKERGGEIAFDRAWGHLAPSSLPRIEELINATMSQHRFRRLSGKKYDWGSILSTIREAYQEASGHQFVAASSDG